MFCNPERFLKNTFEKKAIDGFGWAVIALQAADAVSTCLALATGKAVVFYLAIVAQNISLAINLT